MSKSFEHCVLVCLFIQCVVVFLVAVNFICVKVSIDKSMHKNLQTLDQMNQEIANYKVPPLPSGLNRGK